MYRQGIPDIKLYIEQDTENTPEPKKYFVLHEGRIVGDFGTLKAAKKRYDEIKNETGYEPPQREKGDERSLANAVQDALMARKELYWSQSSGHRGKTGRAR